jgi:hypothetical protein
MENPRIREVFDIPSSAIHKYEAPSLPLAVEEGPINGAVPIDQEEREILLEFASWRENPPFAEKGRSSFVARQSSSRIGETDIAAYKLKGVGNLDPHTKTAKPPSTETFVHKLSAINQNPTGPQDLRARLMSMIPATIVHMGIDESGGFFPVLDPEKPLGGMSHGRGQAEFENAKTLYEARVSACRPISWGRYPELLWKGQPMEFVILGMPTKEPRRAGEAFESKWTQRGADFNPYMADLVKNRFEGFDPRDISNQALKIAGSTGREMGLTIRAAHEAGVCRFAGHLGNFSYLPNGKLLMHDFDSSIKTSSLHPNTRALSLSRDIESAVAGIVHSYAHSQLPFLCKNERKLREQNPAGKILQGYFENDTAEAKQAAAKAASQLYDLVAQLITMRGEFPSPEQQQQWMTIMNFNIQKIIPQMIFEIWPLSNLSGDNPLPYDRNKLVENLTRYERATGAVMMRRHQEIMLQLPPWAQRMIQMGF